MEYVKEKTITVDELIDNLPSYKELLNYINALDPSVVVKIGAAYLRVSTDMQLEYSPEAQLEDIIKYCRQHNIMLPKENIYIEAGVSGRRADKRPEFQKMVIKAKEKEKPIDIIMIHKFDRFARNREDSIVYKSMLRKKYGVEIVSVKEPLPDDKKLAMLIESNLETYGEYYSENLSDEVKKGLRKKANRGEHIGRPPFGYIKVVIDVIVVNNQEKVIREMRIKDDEANIVKQIFSKFNAGDSIRSIVLWLNNLGIKTKNGKQFSDRSVIWILNNPVYIGKMRWTEGGMGRDWNNPNTICKESNFPAIIEESEFDKAQERLKEMDEVFANRKKTPKHEHWLRGLIVCDSCGGVIVKNSKSFQCSNYTHSKCKVSHSVTVKAVEEAIIEQLELDFKNKPINIEISISKLNQDNELVILKNQLQQVELKEERIKNAYEAGVDTLEEYKANKERILNDKKIILERIEEANIGDDINSIRDKIFKKCKNAHEMFLNPEVSEYDKSVIAHELFDKIIFKKNEHKLIIYYKA